MAGKVTRIIVRNGTAGEWSPGGGDIAMIGIGEIGYENDTNKLKIGHGTPDSEGLVSWEDCDYITDVLGVVDDYTNIIELGDDGLLYASGYDDTFVIKELTDLRKLVDEHEIIRRTDVTRTDVEVDGSSLIRDSNGLLYHFPSIKLKPLAQEGLDSLAQGDSAESVLQDFFNSILNSGVVPLPVPKTYTTLVAYTQPSDPGVGTIVKLPCQTASYIDWGDGTITKDPTTAELIHDYGKEGHFVIRAIFDWDNTPSNLSDESSINKMPWLQSILQFGIKAGQTRPQLASGVCAFAGYSGPTFPHNPATAEPERSLDLSNITDMNRMFYNARELNDDLNWVFHTGITSTYKMFQQAASYNNNDTAIDFSKLMGVELIGYMFAESGVNDDTMANIGSWDVSRVADESDNSINDGGPNVLGAMRRLLNSCSELKTQPDLSGWSVAGLSKIRNLETNYAGLPGQQFFYTTRNNIDQPQKVDDALLPQFGQP